ncbi:MAG TPA: argininosuccinate lyase [Terriglobia bacterium]|nr:argininosuccinate lyase [Terriglobia bacterium]
MKLWQGRFEEDQDPVFEKLNRSLPVDAILLDVDVRASRAHARGLHRYGVLSEGEWQAIDQGLESILAEYTPEKIRDLPFEDVHTFVEATLLGKIGAVARKLHTGRSRNDQVATDFRLFVRQAVQLVVAELEALAQALEECGAGHPDTLLPAYTHLRRAQPIRWRHYCMAYVEMFRRDRERFEQSLGRVNILPLGSGAVAGSNFPLDRKAIAQELGFTDVSANSLDATSDRDFVLEFLSNAAIAMTHASRLAEDWIIYSTTEFGFLELSEKITTGSSLMPQKKNPDGLELIRGKAGVTIGSLTGLLSVMKGLPTGYNKDLQEDKEAFLAVFENLHLSVSVLRLAASTVEVKSAVMNEAASDSFMGATDLADFLVGRGVPFRDAHDIVARAVRQALSEGKTLAAIDLTAFSPEFAGLPADYLLPANIVRRKAGSFAGSDASQGR